MTECEWHPSVCAAEAAAGAAQRAAPLASLVEARPWVGAFSATLLISLLPLLLVTLAPLETLFAKHQNVLVTFAAGAMLGDVCLHILPHALARGHPTGHAHGHHGHAEGHAHSHGHARVHARASDSLREHEHGHGHGAEELVGGLAIIAGIMAFLALEKLVRSLRGGDGKADGHAHHAHAQPCPPPAAGRKQAAATAKASKVPAPSAPYPTMLVGGYLNLVADFAHNFTDGLAIGAAFGAARGSLATTLAVLCHEVPHEVGDVAILMRSGMPRWQALRVQLATAVGAMLGTAVGLVAGDMPVASKYVSCFIAGGFIYVATVNVIPSLFEKSTTLRETVLELLAMAAGVAIMVGVALLE